MDWSRHSTASTVDDGSLALATVTGSFNASAPKKNSAFPRDLDQFALRRSQSGGMLRSLPGDAGGSSGPSPIAPPGSRPSSEKKLPKSYSFIYTVDDDDDSDEEPATPPPPTLLQRISAIFWKIYGTYEIVVLVVTAILIARLYPPLGAVYLYPDITSTWLAVMIIFILSGMGLRTDEFAKATKRLAFNGFIQTFSFIFISAGVFGMSRLLVAANIVIKPLADGMVICSCLPATINMVTVLTRIAGGDEAAAVFNCAFGNFLGIFLSPVLILAYLGVSGDVDVMEIFYKLAVRVLTPILIGQTLQRTSKVVMRFVKRYRPYFKKGQQYLLVYIVYTVFCKSFKKKLEEGAAAELKSIFIMIVFQGIFLCSFMVIAWHVSDAFFPEQPKLRCMAVFGCTHKTVAMGVPLINAIYENDPNISNYTLPLLIWHPMQLLLGSLVAPKMGQWSAKEKLRLGHLSKEEEDEEDEASQLKGLEEGSGSTTVVSADTSTAGSGNKHARHKRERLRDQGGGEADEIDDDDDDGASLERSHYKGDSGGSYVEGSNPHHAAGAASASVMDGTVDRSLGDETLTLSDHTRDHDARRYRPKCRSDHHCYEVGIVYHMCTEPEELLNMRAPYSSSRRCRGCAIRITTRLGKQGIRPSKSFPVYICMDCKRYLLCHNCWSQNKVPDWASTLYDLYN